MCITHMFLWTIVTIPNEFKRCVCVCVCVKTINIKQHTDSVIVGQSLVRDKQSRVHLMCILIAIDGIISGLLVKAMTAV